MCDPTHQDTPGFDETTHDMLIITVPVSKALVRDVHDADEVSSVARLAGELASRAAQRAVRRLRERYEQGELD